MSELDKIILTGWIPDFEQKHFYPGEVEIKKGRINRINVTGSERIKKINEMAGKKVILPGLIDAHVHVESSMMTPVGFSSIALQHGTVAVVGDPHEIANVCGEEGIDFMIREADTVPLKFFFTVPSCVPATLLEPSGAEINAATIKSIIDHGNFVALGEMMNFPGVIERDPEVMKKIKVAQEAGLPVDGHAPGMGGDALKKYIGAGIMTDHECSTKEEAEEKLALGMWILIREGSAAKNFNALASLIEKYHDKTMLCTDDIHPDDLCEGHIDRMIKYGISMGIDFFSLYQAAALNPIKHYKLPVGDLTTETWADFIVVDDLTDFSVSQTWINGRCVYDKKQITHYGEYLDPVNRFNHISLKPDDLKITGESGHYRVIEVIDKSLLTKRSEFDIHTDDGLIRSDTERDLLKIAVVNRYRKEPVAVGLIHGFNLKYGALASSISHDNHNLVIVGVNDRAMIRTAQAVIDAGGGIAAGDQDKVELLPLEVGGLMSRKPPENIAKSYRRLNKMAEQLGTTLTAPFMTLAFMALLVIPELKIGSKGLFDVGKFEFVSNRING